MKIREIRLQNGIFVYKVGISFTKWDFHLQRGTLALQTGLSFYISPISAPPPKYSLYYSTLRMKLQLLSLYFDTFSFQTGAISFWYVIQPFEHIYTRYMLLRHE